MLAKMLGHFLLGHAIGSALNASGDQDLTLNG